MTLVAELRDLLDKACIVKSITRREGRTRLRIDIQNEMDEHIVIDFDAPVLKLSKNNPRPDFLFVSVAGGSPNSNALGGSGRLVPIEMSAGSSKSARKITEQLQAGADWANNLIDRRHAPTLLPIYLGGIKKIEQEKLRSDESKVKFRGKRKLIKMISNGERLPPSDPD